MNTKVSHLNLSSRVMARSLIARIIATSQRAEDAVVDQRP